MEALRRTQLYHAQMQVIIERSQERISFRLEGVDSYPRLLECIAKGLRRQAQDPRADFEVFRDLYGCLTSVGDTAASSFAWAVGQNFQIASTRDFDGQLMRLIDSIPVSRAGTWWQFEARQVVRTSAVKGSSLWVEPPPEMLKFPSSWPDLSNRQPFDQTRMPVKIGLFGDSIIRYKTAERACDRDGVAPHLRQCLGGNYEVDNHGESGANVKDVLAKLETVLSASSIRYEIFVIHVGTNDGCHPSDRELRRPVALDDFRAHLHRMIDTIERHREGALVIFTTTLPLRDPIERKHYEDEPSPRILRTEERQAKFAKTTREVVEEAQKSRTKCRTLLADTERGMRAWADMDERGLDALFRDYVHPTNEGNELFAQIVTLTIRSAGVVRGIQYG